MERTCRFLVQDNLSCYMQSIFGTQNGDSPLSSCFSPPALQRENKTKLITAVPTRCKVSLSPYHTMRSQLCNINVKIYELPGVIQILRLKTCQFWVLYVANKRAHFCLSFINSKRMRSFTNEVNYHVTIYTNYSHSPLTTKISLRIFQFKLLLKRH